MPRAAFPGDPKRLNAVVPCPPSASEPEGGLYYLVAFACSMAALFLKSKWVGWLALYAAMLSAFTDKIATTGSGSRLSTITLAFTALLMTYMPEIIALVQLVRGGTPASGS
ncbi:hypothetical protein GGF46_001168 [Coemansia sp. RSA 552]|nr:hypothetical protein GGF46_001168 [Coemansia sp. RSA 552]